MSFILCSKAKITILFFFFFQAEDGMRDLTVTGVQTCALPISADVRAENIRSLAGDGSEFDLVVDGCRERARLSLLGEHNVYNALAAAAVALDRGLQPSEVV